MAAQRAMHARASAPPVHRRARFANQLTYIRRSARDSVIQPPQTLLQPMCVKVVSVTEEHFLACTLNDDMRWSRDTVVRAATVSGAETAPVTVFLDGRLPETELQVRGGVSKNLETLTPTCSTV